MATRRMSRGKVSYERNPKVIESGGLYVDKSGEGGARDSESRRAGGSGGGKTKCVQEEQGKEG